MAYFTVRLIDICREYSEDGADINTILTNAIPHIFDDTWSTFDPEYKNTLCLKILRHYMMREICYETVYRWKIALNDELSISMPKYNILYSAIELVKNNAADEQIATDNVRFALVEIVNIYDNGLTFEPIHRVIFNIDNEALIEFLQKKLGGTIKEVQNAKELEENVKKSWANFGFAYVDKTNCQKYILLETEIKELAVSRLQPEIDEFLKNAVSKSTGDKKSAKPEIDYIHGSEEVLKLGEKPSSIGILLPPIAKDSFFETINGRGPLPRKSFSMGEADEKRFYLECRKLFNI